MFIITVIEEPEKRKNWSKGFVFDFGLPNIKNDHGIESLISTLVNVAPLSKIFIIRHRNSDIPYININQYNDHMLDISIGNIGESTGVFFLHPFDDYIVKSIFNTLQGIRA